MGNKLLDTSWPYPQDECGVWVQRSRFWHPGVWPRELPLIAMVGLSCDESHDTHTYALAGWVSAPSGWDGFAPKWRGIFDGFPVKSLHASELVNRDVSSDSRYRGWTFDHEQELFTRAVDAIGDEKTCGWMRPIGVSFALPPDYNESEQEDDVWFQLFVRLFFAVFNTFPAQNGIDFMFDEKASVKQHVDKFFYRAREIAERHLPGKFNGQVVAFGNDEHVEPLQAADLLAYEWRRRTSEKLTQPGNVARTSYRRIREGRTGGALHHYNAAALAEIKRRADAGENYVQVMLDTTTTED